MAHMNPHHHPLPAPGAQRGLALVSALLMLIIITLLGVSLFLGVSLQQKAAGNSLEKSRALEAAQSVTTAAERWLDGNAHLQVPQSCASATAAFRVCGTAPASPADPSSWRGAGATQVDLAGIQLSNGAAENRYAAKPAVWITYLGSATMGPGTLYEIDTQAYGGNANTVAVTQAVYYVGGNMRNSTPARNLGQ